MKFIASSATLLKTLQQLNGVVSSNAVIPILEYFLFEIEEGRLTITGTDLETAMRSTLPVEAKEDGRVAVPAKLIVDFLKTLPEQPITFTINPDDNTIELTSDKGKYKISGENPDDFPKMPQVEGAATIDVSAAALQTAIQSTLFAISNDELRPAMTGLLFEFDESEARFVSTDGNKLVRYTRKDINIDQPSSFIVPKKALNILKGALPSEDLSIQLAYNQVNVSFAFKDVVLVCRLIDERFPDYRAAIPANIPYHLSISRSELLGSLKRMANFSNKTTYQVRFKIAGNDLQINAQDIDFSNEAHERLQCQYEGEDMEIGFNARFMTDMLNVLGSDDIRLNLTDYNKPGVLTPGDDDENEDVMMLIMPIVLNT